MLYTNESVYGGNVTGDFMTSYSSSELIKIINGEVSKYHLWTIGITTRPNTRKKEHDNPKHWKIWQAKSLTAAQNTESHFLDLGMKGGTGGDVDDKYIVYVYIF